MVSSTRGFRTSKAKNGWKKRAAWHHAVIVDGVVIRPAITRNKRKLPTHGKFRPTHAERIKPWYGS